MLSKPSRKASFPESVGGVGGIGEPKTPPSALMVRLGKLEGAPKVTVPLVVKNIGVVDNAPFKVTTPPALKLLKPTF